MLVGRDWLRPSQQSSFLGIMGLTSSFPTKLRFENKIAKKNAQDILDIFLGYFIYSWPRWDLNPHALTSTTPSRWQVYRFSTWPKTKKAKQKLVRLLVTRLGLEPRTPSLKVMCSTNWAIESVANWRKNVTRLGLEPRTPSLKVMCSTNWAIESFSFLQCGCKYKTLLFIFQSNFIINLAFFVNGS